MNAKPLIAQRLNWKKLSPFVALTVLNVVSIAIRTDNSRIEAKRSNAPALEAPVATPKASPKKTKVPDADLLALVSSNR